MPVASDAPAQIYVISGVALLAISALYIALGIALRWQPNRLARVTRYDPPQGISPAIAAFLFESGRFERSFAAALVSLATKGHLQILQKGDWFTLRKYKDAEAELPPEESAILSYLFPTAIKSYSFNASDTSLLFEAYRNFKGAVRDVATPSLISTHVEVWLAGIGCSLIVLGKVLFSIQGLGNGMPAASVVFSMLFMFVGGSCFVAAMRVWPATLRKLASLAPGRGRPRRPLNLNDAIPLYLTATATFGFVFVAILTSTKFAGLVAAALMMNVYARYLLNAPTSAGRKTLAELIAFRDFLLRADSDRLDHQNEPGKTPNNLELFSPYAVALNVDRGWGEEFAGNLFEMLQIEQAYSPPGKISSIDDGPAVLDLSDRKK